MCEGKVLMFEPDLKNSNLIHQTIKKYQIKDVAVISAAVSEKEGIVDFYIDDVSGSTGSIVDRNTSKHFIELHHKVIPNTTTVNVVTLDSISESFWEPDFIKIDVEGGEMSVLKGGEKTINKFSPAIFFECDIDNSNVNTFIKENNYQLFDFVTLEKISTPVHNNLALHNKKHKNLIKKIIEMTSV